MSKHIIMYMYTRGRVCVYGCVRVCMFVYEAYANIWTCECFNIILYARKENYANFVSVQSAIIMPEEVQLEQSV